MKVNKYEEMLPDEFQDALEKMPVIFVPTGLLEWHGDHLPLGQDTLKAYGICLKTAEKLGGGIVMPPNYYGRPGYSRYTGTLTFSEGCMDTLFSELFYQLKKVGAKVIVMITGHYGPCQYDFVKRCAKYFMNENPDIKVIAMPEYEGITIDGELPCDHAGKWETSMFWYLYPDLIRMDKFKIQTNKKCIYENPPHDFYKEEEEWVWREDLRETASPELGKKCVDAMSDNICNLINNALLEIKNK